MKPEQKLALQIGIGSAAISFINPVISKTESSKKYLALPYIYAIAIPIIFLTSFKFTKNKTISLLIAFGLAMIIFFIQKNMNDTPSTKKENDLSFPGR